MSTWFLPAIVAGIFITVIFFLFLGVISETETRRNAAFTAAKILFPLGLLSAVIKTLLDHYNGTA